MIEINTSQFRYKIVKMADYNEYPKTYLKCPHCGIKHQIEIVVLYAEYICLTCNKTFILKPDRLSNN